MTTYFSIDDGDLRISRDLPSFECRGRPDGLAVTEFHMVPDCTAAIVLLDPPLRSRRVRNLVKVGSGSDILWHAQLPDAATVT